METQAAPRQPAFGIQAALIAALAAIIAALCLAGPAEAAKQRNRVVGQDGKIHACYRVKGKPKGMVRVVRGKRHRCRRGERRVAWSVQTVQGAPGVNGAPGQAGATGATPGGSSSSSPADVAGMEAQIASLTFKLDALEGVLGGLDKGDLLGLVNKVTNLEGLLSGIEPGDLTGALGVLDGVTNADLLETIGALPLLGQVCSQTSGLTSALNQVLNLLTLIGLPDPLDAIECPAPPSPPAP